jgi:hypothetical protein
MQNNVPSAVSDQQTATPDAHPMRPDAPQVMRLWRLADKFRASAARIDDVAVDARLMRADRLLWRLADGVRAAAGRVDDLAADLGPAGRWAW